MPIQRINWPEFRPDQSLNSNVLLTCDGVYPAMDGYRPFYDIEPITDALTESFQGGFSAIASDGDAFLLAGTSAALYSLQSDQSWSSLVGSLSISGRWKFAQFGNYVISVNGDTTREVDLDAGTASTISGAPTATDIAVVGDYVVVARPNGDLSKVRWSAFADHTGWVNGTNQAGEQPMRTGGQVMAIAGGEYGIILQRNRIVRMTRTGDADAPFQFDEITVNYGCAAAEAVAQSGRTIFFYSDRGFMALDDGQVLKNIGSEKVDRAFANETNRDDLSNMYAAVDPQNKLVIWGIPGRPGKLWIYNFELDRWSTARLNFNGIFPGFTTSYSLDDFPSLGYTNLDTLTIGLDDPRWLGGNPRLYFIDEDNKGGTTTAGTLAADFDLGYIETVPGRLTRPRSIRPVADMTSGLTATINAKRRIGDLDDLTSTSTLRSSGVMSVRGKGRYHKIRLQVSAGTAWSLFQGFDLEYEIGGIR